LLPHIQFLASEHFHLFIQVKNAHYFVFNCFFTGSFQFIVMIQKSKWEVWDTGQ